MTPLTFSAVHSNYPTRQSSLHTLSLAPKNLFRSSCILYIHSPLTKPATNSTGSEANSNNPTRSRDFFMLGSTSKNLFHPRFHSLFISFNLRSRSKPATPMYLEAILTTQEDAQESFCIIVKSQPPKTVFTLDLFHSSSFSLSPFPLFMLPTSPGPAAYSHHSTPT